MIKTVEETPTLRGFGPVQCSSSTVLARYPLFVHDTNGYYRELGVPTDATRKQLRIAYMEKGGPDNERLTFIYKMLWNHKSRAEYDATPGGEVFMDEWVQRDIRAKVKEKAWAQRMADQVDMLDDDLTDEYEKNIYSSLGLFPSEDTPEDALDSGLDWGQDVLNPAKFSYAFYTWRTKILDWETQLQALAVWQEHLVRALSRRGVTTRFSVGLFGRMEHSMVIAKVGNSEVFFLNHLESPTADLAERAVAQWLTSHITPSQIER